MNTTTPRAFLVCVAVSAAGVPALADPVDDALARWDTTAARRALPLVETADTAALYRWGLLFFLDGDYAKAEEVMVRIPSPRGKAAALVRLVRETRRRVRGFVQVSSAGGRFLVLFAPGPDEMAVPYLLEAAEAAY